MLGVPRQKNFFHMSVVLSAQREVVNGVFSCFVISVKTLEQCPQLGIVLVISRHCEKLQRLLLNKDGALMIFQFARSVTCEKRKLTKTNQYVPKTASACRRA